MYVILGSEDKAREEEVSVDVDEERGGYHLPLHLCPTHQLALLGWHRDNIVSCGVGTSYTVDATRLSQQKSFVIKKDNSFLGCGMFWLQKYFGQGMKLYN